MPLIPILMSYAVSLAHTATVVGIEYSTAAHYTMKAAWLIQKGLQVLG